ncbi:MAG TPA: hypothetical protein VKH42_17390 [Vicinamibacterales bacterium]|nr:hypothetical protein [Vicinamibacterales bacterium]
MTKSILVAGALTVSALAAPAFAQGKSKGNGNGHGAPPSRNVLAAPPEVIAPTTGAAPFAWVDDATVLDPGAGSVGFAILHFSGAGVGETDFPVVDAALGLAPRVQLAVAVPHVVAGADETSAAGGIGTTSVAAKVAILNDPKKSFKLAVSPTLMILGSAVAASLNEGEGRTQFGLPVSAELDRGMLRLYGAGGFFTSGVTFAGAGASVQTSPRTAVSLGFSRSWRREDVADVDGTLLATAANRTEISGGVGYVVTPRVVVWGSIGRTIATLDEAGAGTTISGGVSFSFTAPTK